MGVALVFQRDSPSNHNLTFAGNLETALVRRGQASAIDWRAGITWLRRLLLPPRHAAVPFRLRCRLDVFRCLAVHDSARAAARRCPDCRCGKVAVIARSRYAAGQLLFKRVKCFCDQISHLLGSLAVATTIAASSTAAKSLPLILLSAIRLEMSFWRDQYTIVLLSVASPKIVHEPACVPGNRP
jgi:hypothetical protein